LHEREHLEAVSRIAREGDPDRSLAALFVPASVRPALLTLIAFNVELARVGERATEPMLADIRLAWWRQALEQGREGEATGSPVADAARGLLRDHQALREPLERIIAARDFDVSGRIMPDWSALEAYLEGTVGAMFVGAAILLGADVGDVAPAARAGGFAYGLTGLMRRLPIHAARGRLDFPADALRRHGASPEQMLGGHMSAALMDVLASYRERARSTLADASGEVKKLAPPVQSAFLPLALVNPYLAALARARDPLHEITAINPLHRLWRLATWRP
jgi:phytoene synthase